MTSTTTLAFDLWCDSPDFSVTVTVDDRVVYSGNPGSAPQQIITDFDDTQDQHCLTIDLSGKSSQHTTIDDRGHIIQDNLVHINNARLDDIDLGHLFHEKCRYTHDSNGNSDTVTEQFFGKMGCNGRVEFGWQSPFYLWLLENT